MILTIPFSARNRSDLPHCRSQIEAATRMASRLKEGVLLQSHNVAVRADRTYLNVLTPTQTLKFHKWLANNRERCRESLGAQRVSQATPMETTSDTDSKRDTGTARRMTNSRSAPEITVDIESTA